MITQFIGVVSKSLKLDAIIDFGGRIINSDDVLSHFNWVVSKSIIDLGVLKYCRKSGQTGSRLIQYSYFGKCVGGKANKSHMTDNRLIQTVARAGLTVSGRIMVIKVELTCNIVLALFSFLIFDI